MPRNYDTTLSLPYTRVDRLDIEYSQGAVHARIYESNSVVLHGRVHRLAGTENVFDVTIPITSETATTPIPVVDSATGAPTGEHTTLADAVKVLTAISRWQQGLRDAQEVVDAQGAVYVSGTT